MSKIDIAFDLTHYNEYIGNSIKEVGFVNYRGFLPATQEVRSIFETVKEHCSNPENILEFGSRFGFSSSYMLDVFPNSTVHAFDIEKPKSRYMSTVPIDAVINRFQERFVFHHKSSIHVKEHYGKDSFQLAFVDGDHTYEGALADIKNCIDLNIPYIMIDNHLKMKDIIDRIQAEVKLEFVKEMVYKQWYKPTKINNVWEAKEDFDSIGFYVLKK